MALCIDSTNAAYISRATNALNKLVGEIANALVYTEQSYRVGDRTVIRITEGPNVNTAQASKRQSVTLLRRIIASPHWVRITESDNNDCRPDKWLKDEAWSGFKSLIGLDGDAGFMKKVTNTGSSAVANWSGADNKTANLGTSGVIHMEQAPAYILLAHELIHADRITRGLLQMRRTNSTFVVDQRQGHKPNTESNHLRQQHTFKSGKIIRGGSRIEFTDNTTISNANQVLTNLNTGSIWVSGTMELAEEIATVGLSDDQGNIPHDPLAITENMIRAEHNEHKRLKYGTFNQRISL